MSQLETRTQIQQYKQALEFLKQRIIVLELVIAELEKGEEE
jgi:hypothetical protein